MATMKYIGEDEATGIVKVIYEEMTTLFGYVPNIYKVLANNPHVLKSAWEQRKEIMGEGKLDPMIKEFLAWATVTLQNNRFGIETHTARLKKLGYDNEAILEALSVLQYFSGISAVINGLAMGGDTNQEALNLLDSQGKAR